MSFSSSTRSIAEGGSNSTKPNLPWIWGLLESKVGDFCERLSVSSEGQGRFVLEPPTSPVAEIAVGGDKRLNE